MSNPGNDELGRPTTGPDGLHEEAQDDPIRQSVSEMREFLDARPVPDFQSRVMAEIARDQLTPGRRTVLGWLADMLWAPRDLSVRWRPAYLLGAAAVIVVASFRFVAAPLSPAPAGGVPAHVLVQFRLLAPAASEVRLAGSFTNWQPQHVLHQATPGVWTLTLPLAPGVHDYAFVVDGQRWVADPYAPQIDDGFGGRSSRIALLVPGEPRL